MVKRFDCKRNPSLGRWTWLKMVSSALSQRARKQSGKKRSIWMTTKPLEFLKRPNFPNCQKSSGYQLNVIKIKSKKLKMAKRSKKILKRRKTGRYLRESAQISFTSLWQSKVSLLSTDWLAENSWLSSSVQSMKTTASLELSSPTSSTKVFLGPVTYIQTFIRRLKICLPYILLIFVFSSTIFTANILLVDFSRMWIRITGAEGMDAGH